MSPPAVRLIATDLDGTFVGSDGHISDRNQLAFRRAAAAGIELVVATGRPWRWLGVLEPLRDLDLHVLASNGAVRFDLRDGRVTSHDALEVGLVSEVVRDLLAVDPSLGFALEHVDGWSCDQTYRDHSPQLSSQAEPNCVGDIERLLAEPAVKLLVRSPWLPSDRLAEAVSPVIGDRLTMTWSYVVAQGLLEISSAGITKASGLRRILSDLALEPAEAVAFGDMPNDMAMLELVGQGFVMANAHPVMLALGLPVIGDHDDSGVGRQIEQLLAS